MKYILTIQEITPPKGEFSYQGKNTLFEQSFDDLDIKAIVSVANGILITQSK